MSSGWVVVASLVDGSPLVDEAVLVVVASLVAVASLVDEAVLVVVASPVDRVPLDVPLVVGTAVVVSSEIVVVEAASVGEPVEPEVSPPFAAGHAREAMANIVTTIRPAL